MSLNSRLELDNEILELELRLKDARDRLREAHGKPASEDSTDLGFIESMLPPPICLNIWEWVI